MAADTREMQGAGILPRDAIRGLPALAARAGLTNDIVVAVVDGEVDSMHPCFSGADIRVVDTVASGAARPDLNHGTHVASVLLGQSASPLEGLVPTSPGLIVPVYPTAPSGALGPANQLDLARAIHAALDLGARVVNVSGGELVSGGAMLDFLAQALRRAETEDVVVVAAAGNDGCACHHVPAAAPTVIAVGATDGAGRPLASSNYGERYLQNGVMAPGARILGAAPGGGVVARTGTSFAAPIVSGIAAMLLGAMRNMGVRPSARRVREALIAGAARREGEEGPERARYLRGEVDIERTWTSMFGTSLFENTESGPRISGAPEVSAGPAPANVFVRNPQRKELTTMSDQLTSSEIVPAAGVAAQHGASDAAPSVAVVPAARAELSPRDHAEQRIASSPAASRVLSARGITSAGAEPSGACGCQVKPSAAPGLVYALGYLHYDFGTEARLDYFVQQLGGKEASALNPQQMAEHLSSNPYDANALIWTLNIDTTPIYAIVPQDQFATLTYLRLVQFLSDQESQGVERMSVGGTVVGTVRLMNGTVVPAISPVTRGMFNWKTEELVQAVRAAQPGGAPEGSAKDPVANGIKGFLRRIYYELRNLGQSPSERAINFAATNAYQLNEIYSDAVMNETVLDKIQVDRSPICRPESDCWDVSLVFFNPNQLLQKARRLYRYTVDVSDVVPVTVGDVRSWDIY